MTSAQVNEGGGVCRLGDHVTAESFSSSAGVNTAHNAEVGVQMTHSQEKTDSLTSPLSYSKKR